MNFVPPPLSDLAEPRLPLPEVPALSARWDALADAARAVALLAGEADVCDRALGSALEGALGWRRERAGQFLADFCAIMRAGLATLLAARAGGGDPRAAASALLYEFSAAQGGLAALVSPAR